MRHATIYSLNQISHANQFVDRELESEIRTFHQHGISVAGTLLEDSLSQPFLSIDDLKRAETFETRFSHITDSKQGCGRDIPENVSRWRSLARGSGEEIDFPTMARIFAQAIGADPYGRRPYPSGGALYSVEAVAILGESVGGAENFSVLHYLPVSNSFEILPGGYDRDTFGEIYKIEGVAFYVAYFINLKKAIFKYRSRGYRLALLEIGSMYQQMLQAAQTHGLGSRVLSGFSEYTLAKNCGLDCRILLPGIVQAFGRPEEI